MEIKSIGSQEIRKLMEDVALIKKVLFIKKEDPEGELTEWAKKQLEIARKTPSSQYISHEEVKKRIFSKK
jgi:cell division protein FtsX